MTGPSPHKRSSSSAEAPAGLARWLPGLATVREYQLSWLRHDIVAGIVLTTMLVPVGIAYAVASGLPGVYGLYATIIPLIAYAVFGPSRILVLGPDSSLAPLILAVVLTAIFANVLAPYDPLSAQPEIRLAPPSWAHPFGTDDIGRGWRSTSKGDSDP